MRRLFGTDGVRGLVGESLTEEFVRDLGQAYSTWAGGPRILIGCDTRSSGPALAEALAAGIVDGGGHALDGGILPTAAVALLSDGHGAVISASHNPPEYNGVKFFREAGQKLADADEEAIEQHLGAESIGGGSMQRIGGLAEAYVDSICARFGTSLAGLRVACDCANGALAGIAGDAFTRLGASVETIGDSPDGANINVGCGAISPEALGRFVASGDFDLGVAFDGDGDRVMAIDATGEIVDGDQIVAILALHLDVDTVAVTIQTNAGFHELMAERDIRVITTDVGDRYVAEALRREGAVLGGEQSGHVIVLDGHSTGDGLAAGLLLCGAMVASGSSLGDLASVMPRWTQVKENVPARAKAIPLAVSDVVATLNAEHAGRARVLVRPSGTEQLVRVMVESLDPALAQALLKNAVRLVEGNLA